MVHGEMWDCQVWDLNSKQTWRETDAELENDPNLLFR